MVEQRQQGVELSVSESTSVPTEAAPLGPTREPSPPASAGLAAGLQSAPDTPRGRGRDRKVGLALSGGAVRGAAHIGVLEVLEANGIKPDFVAGTSVGAIVGAAFACGIPAATLEEVIMAQTWSRLIRPSLRPRVAIFDVTPVERLLKEVLVAKTFADLQLPLGAVCCDISSGEVVALRSGNLVEAVMASSSVPGLFPARERDGRLLVDGGVVNNLPVDIVRDMGADIVIAVDLLEMPSTSFPQRPSNLFESWQRSLYYLIQKNHLDPEPTDHTIVPQIAEMSFTDFAGVPEMIRRGQEAAQRSLPRLRELFFQ